MKIKNFKVEIRLKEIYNSLKQKNIKITPEIETLISLTEKELLEFIKPAVVFETFDIKDEKIKDLIKSFNLTKNVVYLTFIISTLGENVEKYISEINDELKRLITDEILKEYLSSSILFIVKLIKEKIETDVETSSVFLLPEELFKDVISILQAEKINVSYMEKNKQISPIYTSFNYLFWLKTTKSK